MEMPEVKRANEQRDERERGITSERMERLRRTQNFRLY